MNIDEAIVAMNNGKEVTHECLRNTVTKSLRYADVEAWTQSGQVEAKTWYTSIDERVCIFCGDMLVVPRDGDKSDAVMNISYEDIKHQPLHVRCRCVLLPVMKDIV